MKVGKQYILIPRNEKLDKNLHCYLGQNP